jgi:hypothetical protein
VCPPMLPESQEARPLGSVRDLGGLLGRRDSICFSCPITSVSLPNSCSGQFSSSVSISGETVGGLAFDSAMATSTAQANPPGSFTVCVQSDYL